MTSVPEYGLLHNTSLPVLLVNSWITDSGNPLGYVGNDLSKISPAISQWPVVVSFPQDCSWSLQKAAVGFWVGVSKPMKGQDLADFVLSRFRKEEQADLEIGLEKAYKAVESMIKENVDMAMNKYNG